MYLYVKALHILFVVTWFAGLFYFVRLLIYNTEAGSREAVARDILRDQYRGQLGRLWRGITVPSALLTGVFGVWMWHLYGGIPLWLLSKLGFVILLYLYHGSCWWLYRTQLKGEFRYSGTQLRIWNEVATIFLVAIVFLVVLKNTLSMVWGLLGLFVFIAVLMSAIALYKKIREGQSN
jgi:putative membrane protein